MLVNHYFCAKNFTTMDIVLFLHSLLRWAVLIFGVWAVINGLTGTFGKRDFSSSDRKSGLLFMIFCDIQLLLGLILYVVNGWAGKIGDGMGKVMKDGLVRFFTVEHTLMMLLALVLVHVGYASMKKQNVNRHKKMLIFFGLALLIILASIPWSFRTEIARPLIRGL